MDAFPVIFLDVDGVLNRGTFSAQGLDTDKCDLLADLVRETGARIVVSSTWRLYPNSMQRLVGMFVSRGIQCVGYTPDLSLPGGGSTILRGVSRHLEIREWLMKNSQVKRYAILDDDPEADDGTGRFVRTASDIGLTARHASEVVRILSAAA